MKVAVWPHPRLLLCLLTFCLLTFCHSNASAQYTDQVVLQGSTPGSQITIWCEIVEYNNRHLTARTRAGKGEIEIPSTKVIKIKTWQCTPHKAGIKALDEGQTEAAETQFTEALKVEPRVWMRREILALLTRCALRRQDYVAAGLKFQLLFKSNPETAHFDLVPLFWTSQVAEGETRAMAITWLKDPEPIARLLGASLLLFDSKHGAAAQDILTQLARTPGEQVRLLAIWQQRRRRIQSNSVDESVLKRWIPLVDNLEPELRAGPYYILGQGYLVRQDFDMAAATFLKVPLVHDSDHPISAQSMLAAGQALARIGMQAEAAGLYSEILTRYKHTSSAAVARQELNRITANP